jgi:hypothetical protein
MEFDEFNIVTLPKEKHPVVFVIATTGDGECTQTMLKSWAFLMNRGLPNDSLGGL